MSAQSVTSVMLKNGRPLSGWHNLRNLAPYLGRYKGTLSLGLLLLLLAGIIGALPQLMIGAITDCLRGSPQPLSTLTGTPRDLLRPIFSLYIPSSRHTLSIYCCFLVGVMLLKDFLMFCMRRSLIGVSREIECNLRNDLTTQFMSLKPEFYARNRTGDLMSRATNDLGAIRMLLGQGIMFIATTISVTLITVYFMIKLSPALAFWVLLPMPGIAIAHRYFGRRIHHLSDKSQEILGSLSARLHENLAGIRVVRGHVQEAHEIEQFDRTNRGYTDRNIQLIGVWSIFFPALSVLTGVTYVMLLWVGGRQAVHHEISVGTLWAFYAFLAQLAWPMMALGWATNIFQRGAASAGRLNSILNSTDVVDEAAIAPCSEPLNGVGETGQPSDGSGRTNNDGGTLISGEIEFRRLTFIYPKGLAGSQNQTVLRDINLRVPSGSTLAIVGPTGSGKSTLAALITRLWEPPPGSLLLDGRPIQEWALKSVRHAIGYVPQDTFLFSGTIRENIAFGVTEAPEKDIFEAAEIAGIAEDIQGFPRRFETIVGERGITLSGGQKQRTALARAIVRRPPILILDDALSSVDTETEMQILSRLREVMRQRTTILISHRVSTVKFADQIIVLREGQIVEQGTHEELLAREAYYADLHQRQMLEEDLARQ